MVFLHDATKERWEKGGVFQSPLEIRWFFYQKISWRASEANYVSISLGD